MTAKVSRAAAVAVVLVLTLTGCTAAPVETTKPAAPTPAGSGVPVPVLKVGDPFTADLLGDGQATITVVGTEVSGAQLVVTVKVMLNKAGEPVTGGPENFLFKDSTNVIYRARTSNDAYPPELASVDLATTGQQLEGKIIFDVPAELVAGGQIQLITGRMVHALWKVQ